MTHVSFPVAACVLTFNSSVWRHAGLKSRQLGAEAASQKKLPLRRLESGTWGRQLRKLLPPLFLIPVVGRGRRVGGDALPGRDAPKAMLITLE